MEKIIFKSENIDLKLIEKALKNNKIIIYPTDTVYGVAASINSILGLKKIYEVKERNFNSPLIALLSKSEYIEKVAVVDKDKKEIIKKLTDKYWPGALTIILNKREDIPDIIVSGGNTIGLRVPALKISQDIIEAVGGVLPTTSANISGKKTPRSFIEIDDEFKNRVDILIDNGESPLGIESTILDLTKEKPVVLREGAIKKEEIEKFIGKI